MSEGEGEAEGEGEGAPALMPSFTIILLPATITIDWVLVPLPVPHCLLLFISILAAEEATKGIKEKRKERGANSDGNVGTETRACALSALH